MISTRARLVAVVALLVVASAFDAAATTRPAVPPPTPVPPHGSPSPFPTSVATPSDPTREPAVPAAAALLADLDTGQVLYTKDPGTPRPIASVTKIMTALLTLETLPMDKVVHVDPRAVFERDDFGSSSTLGLRPGEPITVENLLYALLLGSANDAADALAIAVDGSVPAFVRRMNERAQQLGMRQTRFFSANGLDDRGHSTPRDLLRLVRVTDASDAFTTITATRFRRIPAPHGPDRVIQNRNALLWLYAGAFGTKTGTTAGAGACLVASAARDGRRLVAIVLDAPREPFSSAATLLEYGFEGWENEDLVDRGGSARHGRDPGRHGAGRRRGRSRCARAGARGRRGPEPLRDRPAGRVPTGSRRADRPPGRACGAGGARPGARSSCRRCRRPPRRRGHGGCAPPGRSGVR